MEWILNLVGQGRPHAEYVALAAKLFFILRGEWRKIKRGSVALLKVSAPVKSTPENVATEPLDKEKKGSRQRKTVGEVVVLGQGRGRKKGKEVGESAASRVIYLPNQDTMSRL